jgi:hypothetical protein
MPREFKFHMLKEGSQREILCVKGSLGDLKGAKGVTSAWSQVTCQKCLFYRPDPKLSPDNPGLGWHKLADFDDSRRIVCKPGPVTTGFSATAHWSKVTCRLCLREKPQHKMHKLVRMEGIFPIIKCTGMIADDAGPYYYRSRKWENVTCDHCLKYKPASLATGKPQEGKKKMGAKRITPPRSTKLTVAELVSDIIHTAIIEGDRNLWKERGFNNTPVRLAPEPNFVEEDICEHCGQSRDAGKDTILPHRDRLFRILDSDTMMWKGVETICVFLERTTLDELEKSEEDGETVESFLSYLVNAAYAAGPTTPKNHFGLNRKVAFFLEDDEMDMLKDRQEYRVRKAPVEWVDLDENGELNSIFIYLEPIERKGRK